MADTKASSSGAETREELRENIKKMFFQLTQGCGRPCCSNAHCASNPAAKVYSPNEAAAHTMQLVAEKKGVMCTAPPEYLTLQKVRELAEEEEGTRLIRSIGLVFGSMECLEQSFLRSTPARGIESTTGGVDVPSTLEAYDVIRSASQGALRSLTNALERLATNLLVISQGGYGVSKTVLRPIFIALLHPILTDPGLHDNVLGPMACVVSHLNEELRTSLSSWFAELPEKPFSIILKSLQSLISYRVLMGPYSVHRDKYICAGTRSIAVLYNARESSNVVPRDEFYNEVLSENLDLQTEFIRWYRGDGDLCFTSFPYILTPFIKSKMLKNASALEMRQHRESMFLGSPFLVLRVRREHVIQDALNRLNRVLVDRPGDLKKELKVKFEGEEGVDEGGVQKEFFQIIIRDLFDAKFGMFNYVKKFGSYWFESSSEEYPEFKLIGILLGLAIYNDVILDLHFPPVVYKYLMGMDPEFDDLARTHPEVHHGLQCLLDYSGEESVEEVFGLTFEVRYRTVFGENKAHNLVEDGANKNVTEENREEYVQLYTKWLLGQSVENQVRPFVSGFRSVCEGPLFEWFRMEELEMLVCGDPVLDLEALESVTVYDSGYTHSTPVIRYLWEVLHSLTPEQQRKFLFFTTGTDRAPIGGLKNLRFIVTKHGPDSDNLPQSHTCFNVLLLPNYSTKEKLRDRLLTAIENSEGFGML